ADCHDALDTRLTKVGFSNASDFGEKHPQFRPTFYAAYGKKVEPSRVSLDDNPVERSGLKFPHDIHMDAQGGVARMAISLPDYDGPLECSSCHELTDDRIGYKPVEMEPSCESCHSLVFDEVGGEFRSLKHGKVIDMRADLMRMGRGPRRAVVTGRQRPGQFASGGTYAVNFGRPASSLISINRALLPGGVCGDCHIPSRTDGRPDVTPVNLPDRYMQHGFFSHEAHEDEKCSDCHKAATSSEATDLLLPDLASCRDCHEGASAVKTAEIVPSSCAMCHGYHTPTNPWPANHPILQSSPTNMDNSIASLSTLLKK
ncbi:MAG: cytochrome c3 family protein, partial [Pseudomonadota bacterium]